MKVWQYISLVLLSGFVVVLTGCLDPPNYPPEPEIEFVNVSKTKVKGMTLFRPNNDLPPDSIEFTVSFTDGDGDIGIANNDPDTCAFGDSVSFDQLGCNAYLVDSRTGSVATYRIPLVTPKGNIKAISGEIKIKIYSPFICLVPFGSTQKQDTVFYTLSIKDQAGNRSNDVLSPIIVIDCSD